MALGVVILLAIAGGIAAWRSAPYITAVSPLDGTKDIPARAGLEITFSRPMRAEMVEARLQTEPARTGSFAWQGNKLIFSPDHPWPGGTQVIVTLARGARATGTFGMPVLREQSWSFTTAQMLLAYLWPADGPANIYALDPLSGEVKPLTQEKQVFDFSLSPDGLQVYFSAVNGAEGADLYRLDLLAAAQAGDELAKPELMLACAETACRYPQPSSDGRWLAYERILPLGDSGVDNSQVWLLSLQDGESQAIGEEGHLTRWPEWSSTGLLAFYDRERVSYVLYQPDTHEVSYIFNDTGEPGCWARDGGTFLTTEIQYTTEYSPTMGSSHLILYDLVGHQVADLTQDMFLEDATPAFSPDGTTIAFGRKYLDAERWTPGRQLWLMGTDGSNPRQVTNDAVYKHHDFAWSQDGQWLAYVRFNQAALIEPPELWMARGNGSQPIQLVIGGYAPQWIP
jgi:hypothetical protein